MRSSTARRWSSTYAWSLDGDPSIADGRIVSVTTGLAASDPGYCRTDMGAPCAPFSAAKGAEVSIMLATLDQEGPTGRWFFQREPKA
jgi:hypothetical protein